MELFIEWITQIIIFLLLASFVDFLLPDTNIKKYSKLVIGLILILIFLKPLFSLLTIDMKTSLEQSFIKIYDESEEESFEKMMKIEKEDIQASKDAYILEEMGRQL